VCSYPPLLKRGTYGTVLIEIPPGKLTRDLTLLTSIREILGSNLGRDISFMTWGSCVSPQSLQANFGTVALEKTT
jgi:hypothetical protein